MKISVKDFIKRFRALAGDDEDGIPEELIIQGLNWAFNSLPSVPKLDKAFAKHYTTPLDANGHWRWKLNQDFRYISNSPFIHFFTSTGGDPCPINICPKDNKVFYAKNGIPSYKVAGTPCEYTLEREYDDLYLILDRPSNIPLIIDYIAWGYPKNIESATKLVEAKDEDGDVHVEEQDVYFETSAPIENLILSTVRKCYYEEASDFAFAGAIGDYLDNKLLPEAIQMVNKGFKSGQPIILGEH